MFINQLEEFADGVIRAPIYEKEIVKIESIFMEAVKEIINKSFSYGLECREVDIGGLENDFKSVTFSFRFMGSFYFHVHFISTNNFDEIHYSFSEEVQSVDTTIKLVKPKNVDSDLFKES